MKGRVEMELVRKSYGVATRVGGSDGTYRLGARLICSGISLPALGASAIAFPLYESIKPGQPTPFGYFRWIRARIIVVALVYALMPSHRDHTLGEWIGSVVADASV